MGNLAQQVEPLTPSQLVDQHYEFPEFIEVRDYQTETIDELAPLRRGGYYLGVGIGKTFISTKSMLYKKITEECDIFVCAMPPVLTVQWKRWLEQITPKPRVLIYEGSPAQRALLKIQDYDFILMSIQIFKKDYEKVALAMRKRKPCLLVDEAHSIKNVGSENHKAVNKFVTDWDAAFMPLTATPLTTPMDGYAFIKMVSPGIYRNLKQYENIHVASWDYFGNPAKWQNLELLSENMKLNSVSLQRRDVQKNLPPVVFTPIEYALAPTHLRLYRKLVEDQLLLLPDGGKIDATERTSLYHKVQQIVINYDYFSGVETNVAAGLDLVDTIMDEASHKLVIVGNYRLTNAKLVKRLKKYNAVAVYGDVPQAQKAKNIQAFIDDPTCRVIILQPSSAGFGIDGLQKVCSDMLFLELPQVPRDFHQTVGRLDRDGQKNAVNVRIAVAQGTIQMKLLGDMLQKDELIGRVTRNVHDLRAELFGTVK